MHGRKIEWEPKDGHCLLHSLSDSMWNEFQEFYNVELLKTLIFAEIQENNDRYRRSFDGSLFELLTGINDYIKNGNYAQNCVDLCVDVACRILDINIGIFQNVGGSAQCINYSSERPTNRDIFLCYNKQHYESIMYQGVININADKYKKNKKNCTGPTVENLGEDQEGECTQPTYYSEFPMHTTATGNGQEQPNINVPLRSTSPEVKDFLNDLELNEENGNDCEEDTNCKDEINFGNNSDGFNKWQPSRNFEQSDSNIDDPHFTAPKRSSTQEAATDCTDLTSDYSETHTTDSSTATTLPHFPEYRERPQKYSKDPINNRLMEKIVAKVVDEVPWDINGTCKYIVQCCSENWLNKTRDGRYFHLRTTGKDPNISKRVGHCQGSFVCEKEDCYKRTYENTINRIDFHHNEEGKMVCGPCSSYVTKIYCGVIKRITFDRIKGHAIVEHERVHNCNLKPNKREKERIIDSHPMPISGFNTPLKMKKAMMRMKMDRKEYGDVKEIAESISAKDLKARISRLRRDASRPLSARDECEVYAHIRRLKKEFQVEFEDPYLVYKECCSHEVVGEDGSFVFKTCKSALEIAAKMSGTKNSKVEPSHLQKEPAFFNGMHSRVHLYKSLTLWVYHSAIRKMMLLAIMEAP